MTARLSTGLVNALADTNSLKDCLTDFVCDIFTGTQPSSADSASSGTLLCTVTNNSGAYTAETQATGTVTLTGGGAGSVDSITMNGIELLEAPVPFNTSLPQTAADVALAINLNPANKLFEASAVGAIITLTALPGLGATVNTWAVVSTATTITTSDVAVSGGVTCVNGLRLGRAVAGVISKLAGQVWSGNNVASGTAGWFRLRRGSDTGTGASTTALRYDGAISTSGAQMNLGSLSFTISAPTLLSSASFTLPMTP